MAFIRLDKKAYEHNLKLIASKAGGFDKVICVLKDNAYGHGVLQIAALAKELGIKFIALKNEDEAQSLKDLFANILILSHIPNGCENEDFIYALNSKENLHKYKKNTKLHIALDTGMHRNGVFLEDLPLVFAEAKKLGLRILGLFTHFANSDEIDSSFFVQRQKFKKAKELASSLSAEKLCFHSHNSSALFRCLKLDEDELCRVGLVQFGYSDFESSLKKVLSLYANKLSSRILRKNESLGYGLSFTAKKDMSIATYDLGYADGLFRYSGIGELLLANKAPLLGRMSMDSFSCEDFGEELCVFDDARIWAKFFNTIEYEILVKLNANIKRILC